MRRQPTKLVANKLAKLPAATVVCSFLVRRDGLALSHFVVVVKEALYRVHYIR